MSESLTARVTKLEEQAKMAKWVVSIVGGCLVAFGGLTWVSIPERARKAVDDETVRTIMEWKQDAGEAAEQAKRDATRVAAIRQSLGTAVFEVETFKVDVEARGDWKHGSLKIEKKDVCSLSHVQSYAGSHRMCSLKQSGKGWELKASGRKGSVICEATCFNLQVAKRDDAGAGAESEQVATAGV